MTTKAKKVYTLIVSVLMLVTTLLGVSGGTFEFLSSNYVYGFTGEETISMSIGGSKKSLIVSAGNIDPMTLTEGEEGFGNIVISDFNVSIVGNNENIVYSTKWPYKYTPSRNGSYEYAFSRQSGSFKLVAIKTDGGIEIPVNGIVVSTLSDAFVGASVGTTLSATSAFNSSFRTYAGAVEINGTGICEKVPNKQNIRLGIFAVNKRRDAGESIYYNNEWGANSAQNEFGGEIRCTLNDNGEFIVDGIRNVRDTTQLSIGAKSFVLSIHESYRAFLVNDLVVKMGDKVNLIGMKFVNLTKSSTATVTSSNPTQPIKPSDLDDINGNKYFPGFRAPNYLMYYDKNYVKSTHPLANNYPNFTGCNDWGYEVLVRVTNRIGTQVKGTVISSAKQLDSLPDDNCFILSGNGTAETFLINNSLTGAEVVYDTSTNKVTVTSTPLSYISTATHRFEVVNQMMQDAIEGKYKLNYIGDGDSATDNKWTRAKARVEDYLGKETDLQSADSMWGLKKAMENFNGSAQALNVLLAQFNAKFLGVLNECYAIESMSYQNPIVMSISAWHRPNALTENTLEGVQRTMAKFKKVNLNTVYLETFWNGYSMSNNSEYVDYHKDFVNNTYTGYNDYLDCFIGEAHKVGIQVSAWVEDFFVGYEGYAESNVLTGKLPNSAIDAPDKASRLSWVIRDYQNNDYCQFEGGKYKFIDPSNPDVRNFLKSYYNELLTKYDLDGINLDYIRYPVQNGYTGNVPFDHGYSEFSANKFLTEQGITFKGSALTKLKTLLNKGTSFDADKVKKAWNDFKTRQVSEFVTEIHEMVTTVENARVLKESKPVRQSGVNAYLHTDVIISTAIFAGSDALTKKNQDWESWVKKGYIEVTTPMAYYTDSARVTAELKNMINKINGLSYNYAGIAPYFMGLAPINEVYQALASLKGGAFGTVIFDSKSILSNDTVSQLLSNGVYGNVSVLPHEETSVLLGVFAKEMKARAELYEISGDKLIAYNARLDKISAMPYSTNLEVLSLTREVLSMQEDASMYATGHATTRIEEELSSLISALKVKYNRMELLSPTEPTLDITSAKTVVEGGSITLTATLTPSVSGTSYAWTIVSGEEFAKLNGNVLTATGVGEVVVRCSVGDITVTQTIKVTAKPIDVDPSEPTKGCCSSLGIGATFGFIAMTLCVAIILIKRKVK